MTAIVVAGGRGERFGGPKQFAAFRGSTVAAHSVAAARTVADTVIVVVPEDYDGAGEGADLVVPGGATRSESVRAGLARADDAEIIVVHDAARPLASPALFRAVVAAVEAGADAAIPGIAVTDTIKQVTRGEVDRVVATVSRDQLVTVQTPQAFRGDDLRAAHAHGGDAFDDAALLEAAGGLVVVVAGERRNMKVTEPGDLELAAAVAGLS